MFSTVLAFDAIITQKSMSLYYFPLYVRILYIVFFYLQIIGFLHIYRKSPFCIIFLQPTKWEGSIFFVTSYNQLIICEQWGAVYRYVNYFYNSWELVINFQECQYHSYSLCRIPLSPEIRRHYIFLFTHTGTPSRKGNNVEYGHIATTFPIVGPQHFCVERVVIIVNLKTLVGI